MYVVGLNADYTDIERPAEQGKNIDRILIRQMRQATAPGKPPGNFILLADRWKEKQLEDSSYVWGPFRVTGGDTIGISWLDEWGSRLV